MITMIKLINIFIAFSHSYHSCVCLCVCVGGEQEHLRSTLFVNVKSTIHYY